MMNKIALIVVLMGCSVGAYPFRCGNFIVQEGQNISEVVNYCGRPDINAPNMITYLNPESDGMNYAVMYDGNGMVTGVQSSRGSFDDTSTR